MNNAKRTIMFGSEFFNGKKILNQLLETAQANNKNFTVRYVDKDYKTHYGSYKSPNQFFKALDKVNPEDRCFHEIIHAEYQGYKLYADIDCPADKYSPVEVAEQTELLLAEIFEELGAPLPSEYFWSNSSNESKTSLHLTVPEIIFSSNILQLRFWNYVRQKQIEQNKLLFICSEEDKYKCKSVFDLQVYSRNKSFRLVQSVKRSDSGVAERYMRPWDWISNQFVDVRYYDDYIIYCDDVDDWFDHLLLPAEEFKLMEKKYDDKQTICEIPEDVDIVKIIKEKVPNVNISSVTGNLFILTNEGTRTCIIGGEENTSDNSYVFVNAGGIFFGCHDADCRGQKQCIYEFENTIDYFNDMWKKIVCETKEIDEDDWNPNLEKNIYKTVIKMINRNYCIITGLSKPLIIKTNHYDGEVTHNNITIENFRSNMKNKGYYVWKEKASGKMAQVKVDLADMWYKSINRNEKTHIGFFPQSTNSDWKPTAKEQDSFNIFRGFRFKKNSKWNNQSKVEPLIRHLKENFCHSDPVLFKYLIQWFAHCVQLPWIKKKTAIVLKSMVGDGKGLVMDKMREIMNGMFVSPDINDIKQYNGCIVGKLMVFLDETTWGGKKDNGFLKKLISEPEIHANEKFVPTYDIDNYSSVVIASNSDWVIPADMGARRFLCLELKSTFNGHSIKTNKWLKQCVECSAEDFYQYLLRVDISDFDFTNAPKTDMLQDQIIRGLNKEVSFWFSVLDNGCYPNDVDLECPLTKSEIYDMYSTGQHSITSNRFSRLIKNIFKNSLICCKVSNKQAIRFRSLEMAREDFEKFSKLNNPWDNGEPEPTIELISEPEPIIEEPTIELISEPKPKIKRSRRSQMMIPKKQIIEEPEPTIEEPEQIIEEPEPNTHISFDDIDWDNLDLSEFE